MRRRTFGAMLASAVAGIAATTSANAESIRGKLSESRSGPATLVLTGGQSVALAGDSDGELILHDPRLDGFDLEAHGHFDRPGHFAIGPTYLTNMFAHQGGQRLRITYWCDICAIRTYAPGVCVCCQKWTDLDLRDPNQE